MRFVETPMQGAYLVHLELLEDERGFFARSWCAKEFAAHGLDARFVQCNLSYSQERGTVRGMHYQVPPFEEAKLVRCNRGAIYDVIIDLRRKSSTFGKHFGVTLTPRDGAMLHVPKGFAHGFLTLQDDTEVFYQMSEFYAPECARGVRWNDPAFGIAWPEEARVISEKDRSFPDFDPTTVGC